MKGSYPIQWQQKNAANFGRYLISSVLSRKINSIVRALFVYILRVYLGKLYEYMSYIYLLYTSQIRERITKHFWSFKKTTHKLMRHLSIRSTWTKRWKLRNNNVGKNRKFGHYIGMNRIFRLIFFLTLVSYEVEIQLRKESATSTSVKLGQIRVKWD